MNIFQIRDQLQGLVEIIYDYEMTMCVLNVLPPNWSSFTTSIYSKKDSIPFDELWAQCILKNFIIKENERSQGFITRTKKLKKEKLGNS